MKRLKVMLSTILLVMAVILTVLIIIPPQLSAVNYEYGEIGYIKGIPACFCGAGESCICVHPEEPVGT
jgi:hypothetical protein